MPYSMRPSVFFPVFMFVVLNSAVFAFAQDAKAEAILKEAKTKFDALKDFSASFSYSVNNPSRPAANLKKSGQLKYSKGKFSVIMDEQHIFCDGRTMWVYLPKEKEVNILPYDPAEGINIESIFKLYGSNAKPTLEGEPSLNGVACHQLFIAVTDKTLEFNQVRLWLNKSNGMVMKAITTNRLQTSTTYEFNNVKTNQGLTESAFRFDVKKYPGITVIDETQ